jgi:hypothetical protein
LVEKELAERQFLDWKWPSFLHCIKTRNGVDGDVESNLRHREGVLRGGLEAGIPDGGDWNCRRRRQHLDDRLRRGLGWG